MQAQLVSAAQQLEQQLDDEITRLDRLGTDDLERIRRERIAEMKRMKEKRHQWHANVSRPATRQLAAAAVRFCFDRSTFKCYLFIPPGATRERRGGLDQAFTTGWLGAWAPSTELLRRNCAN